MKPLYSELKSILECDIEVIERGKIQISNNQTLIQIEPTLDLLIHRSLNTLETILVEKCLEKNKHMALDTASKLILDPDGYKGFGTHQKYPVMLWRILYKENYDDVSAIIASTFESDLIIHLHTNECVILVSKSIVTPFELQGTLESEALTSVKIIVGNKITKASELYNAYKQLVEITELAQYIRQKSQVITYDALLFPMLIKQLKRALNEGDFGRESFIEDILRVHVKPVSDLELEQTALVFFENNLNITETANELFIHRNTLIYRLNKLEGITGYDIRKFNDAINYYLSYLGNKIS